MRIGVISDTHDSGLNLKRAVQIFNEQKVDLVIHCGDWVSPFMLGFCAGLNCKIVSIFGNNERDVFRFLRNQKEHAFNIEFHSVCVELTLDGKRVIAYHGDAKPILDSIIKSRQYDVVFSGHTHKPVIEQMGSTLHVNPGSASGYCGFAPATPTVAIYDTSANSAQIIELAKR